MQLTGDGRRLCSNISETARGKTHEMMAFGHSCKQLRHHSLEMARATERAESEI